MNLPRFIVRKFWQKLTDKSTLIEFLSIIFATAIIEFFRFCKIVNELWGFGITFVIILLHYSILKGILIYKSSEIDTSVTLIEEDIRSSKKIFVTSVIPDMVPSFERRFHPDLIYQLSILAGKYTKVISSVNNKDIVYVLIFSQKETIDELKIPILDGHYAKGYSKVFKELGFNLAFMTVDEFYKISLIKTDDKSKIKDYDFALLGGDFECGNKYKLYKPAVGSVNLSIMKYEEITEQGLINPCIEISIKINNEIFESSALLKTKYDFIKYTCAYY